MTFEVEDVLTVNDEPDDESQQTTGANGSATQARQAGVNKREQIATLLAARH